MSLCALKRSISCALVTWSTCTRRPALRARCRSRVVARRAVSSSRHTGCWCGRRPSSAKCRRSLSRASSSAWTAHRRAPAASTRARVSSSATRREPVELPMKILTPHTPGRRSRRGSSPTLSGAAPTKKAWSHQARPVARASLSAMAASLTVGGSVFGISHMAVTPPAAAAAVPLARSSLCSPPGSRKWTWVSMAPGRT